MESTSNKADGSGRRVSTRSSVRVSVNDLGEEHDLVSAGIIADGFRPANIHDRSEGSTASLASDSTLMADESSGSSSRSGRPSSTSKAHNSQDSLSSRTESAGLTRQTTNSTESTAVFTSESPYQGPSGPSHPYQMYPQNVRLARTLSTTTASTLPLSESSYSGPRGPSHPYALYPQNGGIEANALQAAAIPLGFHGLPDQYRRRMGPDGDDVDDMIGPDGHTEQLPPYSRYPDEACIQKARDADGVAGVVQGATVVPLTVTVPPSTLQAIPGAGGIGLATRNPEFESTEDLGSPRSRHSAPSFTSYDSQRRLSLNNEMSEKRKPPKRWQLWMRRKLCGVIPYWAICLIAVVLVLMGTILGSVVGTFVAKQRKGRGGGPWEPTFDAEPIPVPSDLPPLPLGTYGMPLLNDEQSPTCFQDPSLSAAWNCRIVISGLYLTVSKANDEYSVSLNCNHSFTLLEHVYSYGTQPPLIQQPVALGLVSDKHEPNRGPAWYKMLSYNKTVILPESFLSSATNSRQKIRQVNIDAGMASFKRKGVAQYGDKPWVCNWPDTYLELFIFAQQNSSFSNWSMSPSPSSRTSSSLSTTPAPTTTTTTTSGGESQTIPSDSFQGGPGGIFSSRKQGFGPPNGHAPDSTSSSTADSATTTSSTTSDASPTMTSSSASSTGPFGPIDTDHSYVPPPPPYPRVIKLEERRVSTSGAAMPACTQVEIRGPGEEAKILRDEDGDPIVIKILESEDPHGAQATPELDKRSLAGWGQSPQGLAPRAGPEMSPCGCMWFLT